jgi:ribonuclease E
MSKEIYISSTPHETRLAIVENDALTEIYYERENEYTLAGSIYNGRVTRVLPGMQSSFVDIGLERDAFLYITDFMEEAGDSADFEGGSSESRPPRGDRNGERNDRGDRSGRDRGNRGDRSDQPRLPTPTAEPTDADLFNQAVGSLDPARPVGDSERGGNRRGGRNRRFNSDGTPRRERSDLNRADQGRTDAPLPEVTPEEPASFPESSADQLGEAAPGADGSRRWRGRRGRRGNRGREDFASTSPAPLDASAPEEAPFQEPTYQEPAHEIGASAQTEQPHREERAPRPEGRNEGRDRGRGDRNRGEGRGDRDRSRGDRPAQIPRVPRGFAPSLSLYQVEGSAEESLPYGQEPEIAAPAEPLILPGESLSKYRPASSEPVAPSATHTEAAPAADFVLPGAWDGGNVLPGETLRPRSTSAESSRSDDRGGRDRGGRNDRGGRDNRGRDDRNSRPDRTPRVDRERSSEQPERANAFAQPAYQPEPLQPEPGLAAEPSETLSASHAVEPIHSTFIAPPPVPASGHQESDAPETFAARHDTEAQSTPEAEFEPTEASASFRIDPVPPSTYRQAAPPAEESALAEPEAAVDFFPTQAEETQTSPIHPEPALHPAEPSIQSLPAGVSSISAESQRDQEGASLPELTTLNDLGELHSEPPVALVHDPEAPAPIQHESAVVDAHQAPAAPAYFAPGDGHLEEEELIEEEETVDLHASAFEDQESLHDQQESLEGVAELGSMLREMSIDQITRTEPTLDEDEDEDGFEEDFLEEDQLEDEDSEYAEEDSPEEFESNDADESEEPSNTPEEEPSTYASGLEESHAAPSGEAAQEPRRDGRREDRGRRDGRRGDRNRREGRGDRDRNASAPTSERPAERPSGDRDRSRDSRGGRGSRQSMQSTNLPAISDLLKPGQELLCQIAKEPIAKKGARITSHIALPGRFLVFMPTVHHTGVSRKIESDAERRRLKEILISERGESTGGFIVRTAAAGASEEELRSDLRFLLNLWADIKTRSEASKSPALIYHDLNLIERVLRDQVTDNFSAIWVDTETEYERVLRFLQRFQPSLIRRVKLYTKETPLFEQFGITEEINKALRSKVWLKSGGSIVINQTEALVAIDINTGKFVGKTARLEDTIVKTNLDAIPEIVRQIRLRDLGGIIIIDFIDMDERKNRNKVMAALEEELKSDRAPSKVLQFNDFGLVAITRKRVKQSLERTLSTTCGVCQGTGMVKSPVSVCNDIYIEMRKMHKHLDRGDIMLRVHPEVVKQLKSSTRWLQEMEEMAGKTILVKSDPSLHPEQFDIH